MKTVPIDIDLDPMSNWREIQKVPSVQQEKVNCISWLWCYLAVKIR